jgi:hypothetical protein
VPGSAVWTFGKGHVGEFSPRRVIRTIRGPKWPKERSPGFTLGGSPHPNSPEGATRYGDNRLGKFEPFRVRVSGPFRAKRYFRLTQGKPWAKLFWPLRATDWKRPNSRPGTSCLSGYYRVVPPGQKPSAHRSDSHYPSADGVETLG